MTGVDRVDSFSGLDARIDMKRIAQRATRRTRNHRRMIRTGQITQPLQEGLPRRFLENAVQQCLDKTLFDYRAALSFLDYPQMGVTG